MEKISIVFAICAALSIAAHAQTLTTLKQFDGTDGAAPGGASGAMDLVQGTDGNLYGTTYELGAFGRGGTVFKITPSGALTTLYSFCAQPACADGASPYAGLALGTDGNFYGTTSSGGAGPYDGTIFKITPVGALTTLHRFCAENTSCPDGSAPGAGLVLGVDANFYGTTTRGGTYNGGTAFKITPSGTLTTLYSFCAQTNCADGDNPWAALVQGTDGNLYGTTWYGGAGPCGCGTVFQMTPSGALTTLYSFMTNAFLPAPGGLVLTVDGNFYGTTEGTGADGYGSVFQMTPSGAVETLYSFYCSAGTCPSGEDPHAALVLGTDGNLYGTAPLGGEYGLGTIFQITQSGTLTTLYSFDTNPGRKPFSGLVQASDGKFYGTTWGGGIGGYGTVFSLSTGLNPFIKTVPGAAHVGATVMILGTKLTGTTGVAFGATTARFTIVSPTEIITTVPAGAATGQVRVATPLGTLVSNGLFQVIP